MPYDLRPSSRRIRCGGVGRTVIDGYYMVELTQGTARHIPNERLLAESRNKPEDIGARCRRKWRRHRRAGW